MKQKLKDKGYLGKTVIVLFVGLCLVFILAWLEYPINRTRELPVEEKVSPFDMVVVDAVIPGIKIELAYAGKNNVYGARIYDINQAYLRRGTAEKLRKAQEEFNSHGYTIKIWDAYRPPEAQFKLWEVMPDARFVINPNKGYSYHSRGVALDITLLDKHGEELPMPSEFDNFTARADREYSDVDKIKADNAKFLEKIMLKHGFKSIHYEWWHFTDAERDNYGIVDDKELPGT